MSKKTGMSPSLKLWPYELKNHNEKEKLACTIVYIDKLAKINSMQRGVISLEDFWQLSSDQYDAAMLSSAISSTDAYVLLMSAATGR